MSQKNSLHKLHLGCGTVYFPGYKNIDWKMPSTGKLDLRADVRSLPFENRSCSEIISFHLIEHIPRPDVKKTLQHWFRLLANNGKIIMELPDFDKTVDAYLMGNDKYLIYVFGSQKGEGQIHYWGYNFKRLKKELEEVGFKNVVEKDPVDYHSKGSPCFRIEAIKIARSQLHLEATNICTRSKNRCIYCSDNDTRKTGFLDLALAEEILDQFNKLNSEPKLIRPFLSGEPLLHPEIGELIRMCKKVGKVEIHSNADVLTKEKGIEIINAGLDRIYFTLHKRPDIGKVPEETIKNIKQFLTINDHQVETWIQIIVPHPEKIPDEEKVRKRFYGIDRIKIRRPHNWAKRNSVKGSGKIWTTSPFSCEFLHDNLAVYWDGRVTVCCADLNGKWIIGDLRKETLKEIDQKMDKILNRQLDGAPIPELCSGCERYEPEG